MKSARGSQRAAASRRLARRPSSRRRPEPAAPSRRAGSAPMHGRVNFGGWSNHALNFGGGQTTQKWVNPGRGGGFLITRHTLQRPRRACAPASPSAVFQATSSVPLFSRTLTSHHPSPGPPSRARPHIVCKQWRGARHRPPGWSSDAHGVCRVRRERVRRLRLQQALAQRQTLDTHRSALAARRACPTARAPGCSRRACAPRRGSIGCACARRAAAARGCHRRRTCPRGG